MKFRLRCLDIFSALFLHVADVDQFLLLFDTLVELESSTRCKAGSSLTARTAFDDKIKHLVKEVSQFRRAAGSGNGVPKASSPSASQAALDKLRTLLKDNLKHAAPQSEITTFCHILVKILLASSSGSSSESSDAKDSTDLKARVNAVFLDNLKEIVSSTKPTSESDADSNKAANAKSSVGYVKFELFAPFEGYVTRFQSEVVDDAMLLQLEELAYRGNMSAFSRKHVIGIFRQVLAIYCRKGNEGVEEKVKQIISRNLNSCLECAVAEAAKKETTGEGLDLLHTPD